MKVKRALFCLLSVVLFLAPVAGAPICHARSVETEILTPAERLWLRENLPRLVFAVETEYPPFAFVDDKQQPHGLAHDYLVLLESKLGAHFQQRQFASLDEIFKAVRHGDVQIVNAITKTPQRSQFIAFTEAFITVPNVILVRKEQAADLQEEDLAHLKVSLVKSYAVTESLAERYPELDVDLVNNDLAAILNVSFGLADAAVVDLATATYLIAEKGITNLRVAGDADLSIQLSMGVPRGEPVLHGILQKGLTAITTAERQEIFNRWVSISPRGLLADRRFWMVLGGFVLAILAVLAAILYLNRRLRQQVALRTRDLANEKEVLRKSEERHRLMLQTAMNGIWVVDGQGRLLEVNKAYCQMSGYSEPELLKMKITDLAVGLPGDETNRRFERIMLQGEATFESQHRRKDGSLFDVEVCAQFKPFDGGQCVAFIQDITARKQVEQELKLSEVKYSTAFRLLPDAVSINRLDDGVCLEVNDGYTAISGYTAADVIGRRTLDFDLWVNPHDRATLTARLAEQGSVLNFEAEFRRKDGTIMSGLMSASIIEIAGESCILSITRDISMRKKMENERETLIAQLQAKTAEQEMFIYTASHDLKTPLVTINGFIGLAEEDFAAADEVGFKANMATISRAANRMKQLLDELLELSRFGIKKNPVENVNLGILAQKAAENVSGQISRAGAIVEIDHDLPDVAVDAEGILRVMENLIGNAAKFSAPGNGQARIRVGRREDRGELVCCVCDNGIGIDPRYIGKLFGLFEKLDPTSGGTGTGLAIVKRIVEGHGGRAWAESEGPGRGATFCFTLPAARGSLSSMF